MKLYLDPGHGGADSGAVGNGIKEKDIVLDIALKIRAMLENFENVEVKMSRSKDTTKSLSSRSNEANSWGADYFLSLHCNAANGSARGYEDYIYTNLSDSSTTAKYRGILHQEIVKMNSLQNRGQKKADFYVLRTTAMPAVLTENGFIDNAGDAALMKDESWRQKVAQGHVNGLEKAFNLKKKPSATYKVIAGAFQSRENADERKEFLANENIGAFVDSIKIDGTVWYRVQAGAFTNKENAETRLDEVSDAGISDAYIISD